MVADKIFALPLVNFILNDLKLDNHRFLILNHDNIYQNKNDNVVLLTSPLRKNLLINVFRFCKEVLKSDKIIAHGAPLSFFFILLPWKHKSVIWPIHGGIDIPISNKSKTILECIDKKFKKRIGFHATHIEEDSIYTNKVLSSKAKFVYTPMYLSNTINILKDEDAFLFKGGFKNKLVLVGNSTDPSNNHLEAFHILNKSELKPNKVFSILSYGIYEDYKINVIEHGKRMFGTNFIPIIDFLDLNQYLKLLNEIDFVIFNHERQEAMGVTIQLLSLGKPIFFNEKSPVFKSLKRRGYHVFSLNEIGDFINLNNLDLRKNKELLHNEYSIGVLKTFYTQL